MTARIIVGHAIDRLRTMPPDSVHCVITSPPYWGLRDYKIEPSIWDGDLRCDHMWSAEKIGKSQRQRNGSDGGLHGERPVNGLGEIVQTEFKQGAFCRCGAWRGCFGLEPDYRMYVAHAVEIFREVRRVLRPDGTLWLNLGDSYATGAGAVGDHPDGGAQGERWKGGPPSDKSTLRGNGHVGGGPKMRALNPVPVGNRGIHTVEIAGKHGPRIDAMGPMTQPNRMPQPGLKPKDLCGIPWRVALALQDDGWWLRQDIIWSKPNPMPESVTGRCTKAHEYLFMLAKSERYYFDADAIEEPAVSDHQSGNGFKREARLTYQNSDGTARGNDEQWTDVGGKRNRRSVWTVATHPFPEAHFATFPPALIEPCVLAGCPEGGTILDPFGGAGTTALVADRFGRDAILIEMNPEYAEMARRRIEQDGGMFSGVTMEAAE